MHFSFRLLVEAVAAASTACCLIFYVLSLVAAANFLSRARKNTWGEMPDNPFPSVSILKPLKGTDPEIWGSFCSHAELNYPSFELLFGVSDPLDPACEIVRNLQQKYPDRAIKLIVCERALGTNLKISTLAQMVPHASHEILIVNDSDIRVPAAYVQHVVAPLVENTSVALVTSLYRGVPSNTIGSQFEALGIATDFIPGVLTARYLENGLRFGLGSTLAFRRSDLAAIGGFESIVDYLADDYELGRRISANGKRVELSAIPVATSLPPYTLGEFWSHQMRWWRTIRDARRAGYSGLIFTFGIPWALLTVLASGFAAWALGLFALTAILRFAVAYVSAELVLNDRTMFRRGALRNIPLLLLRDLLAPAIWVMGFFGNKICWRGDWFYLENGRLTPVSKPASTP
jgi:ceramide glucosyltransferase